jgi:hypothetical protein
MNKTKTFHNFLREIYKNKVPPEKITVDDIKKYFGVKPDTGCTYCSYICLDVSQFYKPKLGETFRNNNIDPILQIFRSILSQQDIEIKRNLIMDLRRNYGFDISEWTRYQVTIEKKILEIILDISNKYGSYFHPFPETLGIVCDMSNDIITLNDKHIEI